MSVTNDEIVGKFRDFRKKSGKTQQELAEYLGKTSASISDMERGKVQISATELSLIADFLNIPINSFFQKTENDEYVQSVMTIIQEEPEEARLNSFQMVKLYIEIQSLAKKLLAKPDLERSPEELGEIVTKLLLYQKQYDAMTRKFNSVVLELRKVLEESGITLPNI